MATVADAREALDDLIRFGQQAFSDAQRDRAIRYALEKTVRATGLLRTIGSISVVADDRIITHGLTRFLPGRRYSSMYTDGTDGYRRVTARDLSDLQALLDQSTTPGRPEMISFISTTQCMIYPIADASYTIEVPYEQTAPTWAFGSAPTTELVLPDALIYGGMLWGAKHLLLSGVPSARAEATEAKVFFEEFLDEHTDTDIDLAPTIRSDTALDEQSHTRRAGV